MKFPPGADIVILLFTAFRPTSAMKKIRPAGTDNDEIMGKETPAVEIVLDTLITLYKASPWTGRTAFDIDVTVRLINVDDPTKLPPWVIRTWFPLASTSSLLTPSSHGTTESGLLMGRCAIQP